MNQTTVLLISHRSDIIEDVKLRLEEDDIRTCQADCWERAQAVISADLPQLVVIDSPGPSVVGIAVCREIRSCYKGLLVVLSDDADERTHTLCMSMGADLSFSSNLSSPLLTAHIKALLRRFAPPEPLAVQTFGHLTVDANKRDVFVAEQPAQLSTIEFNLFWALVKKAGCVVSRDDIHQYLYNSSYNGYDRGIDNYISRIRHKIGDDPIMPRYLKTVRGAGYKFVAAFE